MQLSFTEKKNIRKSFGKLKESLSIPNLIEVQKNSYKELTEFNSEAELTKGFDRVFKSIFPIEDLNDKATLEYVSYRLEKPKFDVEECITRGLTYSSALKCTLRLVVYEIDQENNTKDILSAKEQEVYMGEVPMMTNSGLLLPMEFKELWSIKCTEVQVYFLIMIKVKLMQVVSFYLIAE